MASGRQNVGVTNPSWGNPVTGVRPASGNTAAEHFAYLLSVETDCADVRVAMSLEDPGFTLLDVRSTDSFAAGHLPGAVSMPHDQITVHSLAGYPQDELFVVYCAGPHCNGADRAALRLARLGRPVKKMIGGITGWQDEGYPLEP